MTDLGGHADKVSATVQVPTFYLSKCGSGGFSGLRRTGGGFGRVRFALGA